MPAERVLLMLRHRFIVDRWVWELPGGYVDDGEDPAAAAAREVEEETGWRPRRVEHVLSCQPMIGNADYPQELYLARGAEQVGEPHVDETAEVRWVPLEEAQVMIASGDIRRDYRDRGAARRAAAGRRSATSAVNSRTARTSARDRSRHTKSRT